MARRARPIGRGAATITGLGLAAVLLLAGCGDKSDPSGDPGPSGSGSASESSSASASGSPSASASAAADAATGPVLEVPEATVNAPTGWKRMKALVKFQQDSRDPGGAGVVSIGSLPADVGPSLSKLAKSSIDYGGYARDPKFGGIVTVAGVPCYKIAGMIDGSSYYEEYGAIHGGGEVSISFELRVAKLDATQRRELIDSSLATVRWK